MRGSLQQLLQSSVFFLEPDDDLAELGKPAAYSPDKPAGRFAVLLAECHPVH